MRSVYLIVIAVSLSLLLVACGGADSSTPAATTAPVTITLSTNPNPAMMGDVTLTLVIIDENGSPIEGARVDVSVDHTDMTGMGMSGPAIEQGDGKYAINANFSMSGNWKMTVYVRKDSLDYKEDIDLKIQ
jgi:hypothetical protein